MRTSEDFECPPWAHLMAYRAKQEQDHAATVLALTLHALRERGIIPGRAAREHLEQAIERCVKHPHCDADAE
ncbi:hypothetical protein [Cupriavidus oxalaticus]|uniref:Uncharacterized protein n=1 Tax=Cupriavidus oxalaticus TaxID=96344 RepID=A0A5P3VH71_9BURK|nr:hypothetical protein [Cupriavidus oxalaticus]QEZ44722.1 hypothetical protein D2917_11070 [Cupriavidus oxalaticus]